MKYSTHAQKIITSPTLHRITQFVRSFMREDINKFLYICIRLTDILNHNFLTCAKADI